jgi:hypothetical protein
VVFDLCSETAAAAAASSGTAAAEAAARRCLDELSRRAPRLKELREGVRIVLGLLSKKLEQLFEEPGIHLAPVLAGVLLRLLCRLRLSRAFSEQLFEELFDLLENGILRPLSSCQGLKALEGIESAAAEGSGKSWDACHSRSCTPVGSARSAPLILERTRSAS